MGATGHNGMTAKERAEHAAAGTLIRWNEVKGGLFGKVDNLTGRILLQLRHSTPKGWAIYIGGQQSHVVYVAAPFGSAEVEEAKQTAKRLMQVELLGPAIEAQRARMAEGDRLDAERAASEKVQREAAELAARIKGEAKVRAIEAAHEVLLGAGGLGPDALQRFARDVLAALSNGGG